MPWVPENGGDVPPGAIPCGYDITGQPIYVMRAWHEGNLIPGKLVAALHSAYISWNGREYRKKNYEVLVNGPDNWQPCNGNHIPIEAYPGGKTKTSEVLFIGKAFCIKEVCPGRVQPKKHALFVPWNGGEVEFENFLILCR